MKLLITFFTAKSDTFAGVERSIFSLMDGLVKNGVQVYVYTARSSEKLEKFFYSDYLMPINKLPKDISIIDEVVKNNIKDHAQKIICEIRKIVDNIKIDYILSVDQLWGITTCLHDLSKINCKKGILFHMNFQPELIEKAISMNYDNYFAVSEEVKVKIKSQGKKIHLLPNSFVEELFNNNSMKQEDYIFCNSRIAEGKGIEYLIPAFAKYNLSHPTTKLILCGGKFHFGNGDMLLKKIKDLIEKYKLKNKAIILKELKWDEIPKLVRNAKMIVLPTKYESFGIAALEAMAAGKFLVASNVGNLPDLIKKGGILVDYGNSDQIYMAMLLYDNENLRNQMGKRAVLFSKPYGSINVAAEFLKEIKE